MKKKIFWIASYPKSGNTWIRAIIASLFFSDNGIFNFKLFKKIRDFEKKENYKFVEKISKIDFKDLDDINIISKYRLEAQKRAKIIDGDFAFFKTHSANIIVKNFVYTNRESTLGLIYIIRDPRDIVISYANHKAVTYNNIINLMLSETSIYNKSCPQILSSWSHHYNSWIGLKVPKLIIKYEDLLNNTEKILWSIINFFDQNYKIKFSNVEKKINNIIESTNFKKLQNYEKKFGFNESRNNMFFRVGRSMQWKKELSIIEKNKIEKEFNSTMNTLGYL